jgi:hypothetical protein
LPASLSVYREGSGCVYYFKALSRHRPGGSLSIFGGSLQLICLFSLNKQLVEMSEGDGFPFTFGDFVQDLFPDVAKGPSNRINDKEDAKIDYYLVIIFHNQLYIRITMYYCSSVVK